MLTYFPSYRYENPYYLNGPYKASIEFNYDLDIVGCLRNPIEVRTEIKDLVNWIMDVVLDWEIYKEKSVVNNNGNPQEVDITPESILFNNLNKILSKTLFPREEYGKARFGIGKRDSSEQRVSITREAKDSPSKITHNVFCLSSGELSLLCMFGEIIRQADNLHSNMLLENIEGLVLIDEVDLHLHASLQKETLPFLFNLFPKVQFIVSSHSPFLNMGLAEEAMERTQVIDLDANGIVCTPIGNDLFKEVYNTIVEENSRFLDKYNLLLTQIPKDQKPLVITEGKTDYRHIKNAINVLGRNDVNVEFYNVPDSMGSQTLKNMLEVLSKIVQPRIIIGIFDRDEQDILEYLEDGAQSYKNFGNNVYAFAIPLVNETLYGSSISIEHYYNRENLLKEENVNHRRLFLGEEFIDKTCNSKDGKWQTRTKNFQHKVEINGVIDDKVFEMMDLEHKHSMALTKTAFVELIENDAEYTSDFDFGNFNKIIDIIKEISTLPIH